MHSTIVADLRRRRIFIGSMIKEACVDASLSVIMAGFMYVPWPTVPKLGGPQIMPCKKKLHFNSVIQSLLFWLRQSNVFISFDKHNDMIEFRDLSS